MYKWGWIGVCLFLLSACGVSRELYRADVHGLRGQLQVVENRNADLLRRHGLSAARNSQLEQELVDLRISQTACQSEVAVLRGHGANLDATLTGALQRIAGLEAVAARQQAVFDQLRQALDALVRSGKLTVAIVRGQFTVQMPDQVLFDSGQYAIKEEAGATLRALNQILLSLPDRRYQVFGHTDTDGGPALNWKLSGDRSRAVVEYMVQDGMPAERLTFAGAGEYQPTAPNDTPDNKALNRRIEIVLVPDLEVLLAPLNRSDTPTTQEPSP